jgi:hypothetical protein
MFCKSQWHLPDSELECCRISNLRRTRSRDTKYKQLLFPWPPTSQL